MVCFRYYKYLEGKTYVTRHDNSISFRNEYFLQNPKRFTIIKITEPEKFTRHYNLTENITTSIMIAAFKSISIISCVQFSGVLIKVEYFL